jgi:hypothetical protein
VLRGAAGEGRPPIAASDGKSEGQPAKATNSSCSGSTEFGRSGVPLYLLYGGKGEPVILPQILTAASVLDALGKV